VGKFVLAWYFYLIVRKMFRTDMSKWQLVSAFVGLIFLATVIVVPPWNDVCAFATQDNLKTYRSAGFRAWWQIGKRSFQPAERNEYMEINWSLWLVELGASSALASSAFVVSRRQH
jgi:cell division protein FtsW (lipid II flippase)